MLDLNEMFVYDAVTHSYNMSPSNYRNEQHAERITEMLFGNVSSVVSDEYTYHPEGFVRDWGVEETATMLFEESYTDMATFHPVPITPFTTGWSPTIKQVRSWTGGPTGSVPTPA